MAQAERLNFFLEKVSEVVLIPVTGIRALEGPCLLVFLQKNEFLTVLLLIKSSGRVDGKIFYEGHDYHPRAAPRRQARSLGLVTPHDDLILVHWRSRD